MGGKKDSSLVLHAVRQSEIPGSTVPIGTSVGSPWDGVEVEIFELDKPTSTPGMSFSNLYVCILRRGIWLQWTEHRRNLQVLSPYHLTIIPAGLVHGGSNPAPLAWTSVYLGASMIARAAEDMINGARIEIIPQIEVADPLIYHIVGTLEAEIANGFRSGRLFGESLGVALAAHLLADYSVNPTRMQTYRGGMPKYLLRRTIDYMHSDLGAGLHLGELAGNVQMSLWHFCRMFKQSTGLSPHQYLMRERIEEAKRLLVKPGASVDSIAKELGFSDPGHLITVFRRFAGTYAKAIR
jgi:AraC family transcriptional regulator